MLPPFAFMVTFTMNLMNRPHHECERNEHHYSCFREYLRITQYKNQSGISLHNLVTAQLCNLYRVIVSPFLQLLLDAFQSTDHN